MAASNAKAAQREPPRTLTDHRYSPLTGTLTRTLTRTLARTLTRTLTRT